jgi:Undecaprenyl-phosphate glucose phosphotransferase
VGTALAHLVPDPRTSGGLIVSSTQAPIPGLTLSLSRTRLALRSLFPVLAAVSDALLIAGTAIATSVAYHLAAYQNPGDVGDYARLGVLVAWLFVLVSAYRGEYEATRFLDVGRQLRVSFQLWTAVILILLVVAFLAKVTDGYSRGWLVLFYPAGLAVMLGGRLALGRALKLTSHRGYLTLRRIMLVGAKDDVEAFVRRCQPWNWGLDLVGAALIPTRPERERPDGLARLDADLSAAVARVRALQPDDVFIVMPWSEREAIERCLNALLTVPASIHLGAEEILERFHDVRIARVGGMASLNLTPPRLSPLRQLLKRIFDVVAASLLLVALAPLFLAVAALIRLDSPGPALFVQRRYGFNRRPFRIVKFRTMVTLEDGAEVRQAVRGDARVTRVGAVLRRWNIDELPQLVNVLLGQMSLVGPRPHAVIHDDSFGARIALYARRHNVKPGLTGWAQVNGLRGPTETDDAMRRRIEHDLYYIDNWSFWLDLRILVLTVISPKAFLNAC